MPRFSRASRRRISQLHPSLQKVLHKAIQDGPDFSVITGHRNQEDQNEAVRRGTSTLPWPRGKHNRLPSLAVDVAPWPLDWENITPNDINRFRIVAAYIMGVAAAMELRLRSGMDWDRDWDETDEKGLRDFGHLELILQKK